jgi:chromosome segregation ATPase
MSDTIVTGSEQDMANVKSVFNRAIEALTSLPTLAQRLSDLEASHNRMKNELETVRNTNTWLSEQLGATRKERDDLSRELSTVHRELDETKREVQELKARLDERDATIEKLRGELKAEQDQNVELLERAFNAENELAKVREQLDEAMKWIEGIHDTIGKRVRPQEVAAAPFPGVGTGGQSEHVEPHATVVDEQVERTGTDPYRW